MPLLFLGFVQLIPSLSSHSTSSRVVIQRAFQLLLQTNPLNNNFSAPAQAVAPDCYLDL